MIRHRVWTNIALRRGPLRGASSYFAYQSRLISRTSPSSIDTEAANTSQPSFSPNVTTKAYLQSLVDLHPDQVDSDSVNRHLLKLLTSHSISAFISLFHILLHRYPDLKLSTQTWSIFMSRVCDTAHYSGSCMVFHELIDPYVYYSSGRYSSNGLNPHVYFLVNCETLEALASIFVQKMDADRLVGVLKYFKRFYSYYSHSSTYKHLRICKVEISAQKARVDQTLRMYRLLAYTFRGYRTFRPLHKQREISAITSFAQFRARRENIRQNISYLTPQEDKVTTDFRREQDNICGRLGIEPFLASEERNVHSYTQRNSLIDGKLLVADMPHFQALVSSQVQTFYQTAGLDRIAVLLDMIQTCHYSLNSFVVASLCEIGNTADALLLVQQVIQRYSSISPLLLINSESLVRIMRTLCEQSNTITGHKDEADLQSRLNETMSCCHQSMAGKTPRSKQHLVESYLVAMLNCNSVSKDQLNHQMRTFTDGQVVHLSHGHYKKFRLLFPQEFSWVRERLLASTCI